MMVPAFNVFVFGFNSLSIFVVISWSFAIWANVSPDFTSYPGTLNLVSALILSRSMSGLSFTNSSL